MKQIHTLSKISIVSLLFFAGCKKSDSPPLPSFTNGFNVYMVGESNGSPAYWKNGALTTFAGSGTAKSLVISGQDVYIAGQITQTTGGKISVLATVWKNGVQQNLNNTGFATANGIGINGNDLYVAGNVIDSPYQRAVYWKNGLLVNIAPNSYGFANDIIFSGSDFYIAGQLDRNNDSAVIWKNGILQPPYAIGSNTRLVKIAFNGLDLYAAGIYGGQAAFYKNSAVTTLTNVNSGTSAVTFKGNDVYITGAITDSKGNSNAAYWKNGTITILADKYSSAVANGIAFAGDDIYIIGTIYDNGKYVAVYWKNGVQQQLSPSGFGYAIAVGN